MNQRICITLTLLAFASITFAQNVVFESIYLEPKMENLKELGEKMKSHNVNYHATAPYTASVWQVITGQNSGKLLWIMGPFTFADLDSRPSDGGHDEDWMGNVLPLTHGMSDGYYWKLRPDYVYSPSETYQGPVMRVRVLDIRRGKSEEFGNAMDKIMEVYNEKKPNHSMAIYDNFASDQNRDVAIVWQYENFAYFDQDLAFAKLYEEVHGDNSWNHFMEAWREIVESASDEMSQVMPEMSPEQ